MSNNIQMEFAIRKYEINALNPMKVYKLLNSSRFLKSFIVTSVVKYNQLKFVS